MNELKKKTLNLTCHLRYEYYVPLTTTNYFDTFVYIVNRNSFLAYYS